jgi:DNA-binding SARP family transcriptional activator
MHPVPGLHIHLFGGFRLMYEGVLVTTFAQARLQALLAYLLLHRHSPQPRQLLSYLFWPDSTESQSRTNLRQLLHHLQKALPAADQYLRIENGTLQWRPDAVFTLDVAEFERDVIQAEQAKREGQWGTARMMLESAVQRYKGDLLPACYDDWIFPERERLRQTHFTALEELIQCLAEQHDYRASIGYAEALLRHDPLRETTYQQLMRLHALHGDRASALRIYHACVTVLDRELGVKPSSETQKAYRHLLNVQAPATVEHEQKVFSSARPTLIGRHKEWSILQTAWRHAADGHPGLVLISGEAGIGKTRLAEEFLEWAEQQGASTGKTRSYDAEGQLAYAPVTELLRAEPFRAGLSSLDPVWLVELVRLMPELLAEKPDLIRPEPIADSWQRKRLFEALTRAIYCVKEPLLLFIDDLQWYDRDSLEWLHYLLHSTSQASLLIIGATRFDEVDQANPLISLTLDLQNREQFTEIELGPLDRSNTIMLAEQVADRGIDPDRALRLYLQSEGNPLFVTEMVRATVSQEAEGKAIGMGEGARSGSIDPALHQHWHPRANLPSRVYAVIQARLSQLSPSARELASLAATIGREFSIDVLSLAGDIDEEALVRGLDELWRHRLVHEQGGAHYDFSHDLIREVAYTETSAARRALLHRRVAKALEQLHAENLDSVSGQIAAHYGEAGLAEQAIGYYQRAARIARETFSYAEVIHLLENALCLVAALPSTQENIQTELVVLITLGAAYMLAKGYTHPDVERAFLKAWEVRQRLEISPYTVPVLAGLWVCYHIRGNMPQEIFWAEQLECELQNGTDERFLPIVYFARVGTAYLRGDFIAAKQYAERGFGLSEERGSLSMLLGYDPEMALVAYWAHSLWIIGYPDQAGTLMQQVLAEATHPDHAGTSILGMSLGIVLHQLSGEVSVTLDKAGGIITYATEKMIPHWIAHGHMLHGWALAHMGQTEEGINELKQGLAAWQAMGAGLALTYYLHLLAEACAVSKLFDEGLDAVAEALAIVRADQEHNWEAELYRRQGELIIAKGGDEREAEACFLQARKIARGQQARMFELRAATSLSRLWQKQGRVAEAYQVLAEVYNWFTEGFDIADLRQAQAQLLSLA